ncbi:hypothetical protein [Paludibacterium denitrificans]|uniref:hypothetical protein n=1 Tax=Paludibacterium denitrificans TaxID=2675226 RepID=UPI0035E443FC
MDLLERQKLMGHKDPKSTTIYTHGSQKADLKCRQGQPVGQDDHPSQPAAGRVEQQAIKACVRWLRFLQAIVCVLTLRLDVPWRGACRDSPKYPSKRAKSEIRLYLS